MEAKRLEETKVSEDYMQALKGEYVKAVRQGRNLEMEKSVEVVAGERGELYYRGICLAEVVVCAGGHYIVELKGIEKVMHRVRCISDSEYIFDKANYINLIGYVVEAAYKLSETTAVIAEQ